MKLMKEQFMKDNGINNEDMGKENRFGMTDHFMRVFGKMEWPMDLAD